MNRYTTFNHHGTMVIGRTDLVPKHREYCLCHSCKLLDIDNIDNNCEIAKELFNLCIKHNITTPVFYCPKFKEI